MSSVESLSLFPTPSPNGSDNNWLLDSSVSVSRYSVSKSIGVYYAAIFPSDSFLLNGLECKHRVYNPKWNCQTHNSLEIITTDLYLSHHQKMAIKSLIGRDIELKYV